MTKLNVIDRQRLTRLDTLVRACAISKIEFTLPDHQFHVTISNDHVRGKFIGTAPTLPDAFEAALHSFDTSFGVL